MKKTFIATLITLTFLFISGVSHAELLLCSQRSIVNLYIQGDRDDNSEYANKLIVRLSEKCNGNDLVYLENTHKAYNGILSTLLTAHVSGQLISVYVNTSKALTNANQLSIVILSK